MNFDPLDTCPYDPVHRILRSRMQYHLTRCAVNYPSSNKKQCPYDARHLVNPVEFNYHVSTCPSRESVLHYKIVDPPADNQPNILPVVPQPPVPADESWENDIEHRGYNPSSNILERPVYRMMIGASKAKKKKFRMEERLRIQELDREKERIEKLEKNNANSAKKAAEKAASTLKSAEKSNILSEDADQECKPLRRPKKLQTDLINIAESSINNSVSAEETGKSAAQNPSVQNNQAVLNSAVESSTLPKQQNSQQILNSTSNPKPNPVLGAVPKTVPFTYAAALNKGTSKAASNIHNNINNIPSTVNHIDNNIEKLSKTIQEIALGDQGYQKKSEPLNKSIEVLKNNQIEKKSTLNNSNNLTNNSNTVKTYSRCAANFGNRK